jgi:hypothetical protein
MRKIKESVAEHGEQGVVDMHALEMQNIPTKPSQPDPT